MCGLDGLSTPRLGRQGSYARSPPKEFRSWRKTFRPPAMAYGTCCTHSPSASLLTGFTLRIPTVAGHIGLQALMRFRPEAKGSSNSRHIWRTPGTARQVRPATFLEVQYSKRVTA